ncbi:ComEC/Rec2 family competence protein [Rhodoflexus sp.]
MLTSKWETLPFVRIVLLVAAGIVTARYLPVGAAYAGLFVVAVATYLYLQGQVLRRPRETQVHYVIAVSCVYAALFSFGALRMWQTEPRERLSIHASDSLVTAYEAVIISRADRKASGNSSLTAEILRVHTPKGWLPADAKVQLSLRADSLQHAALTYGSRLLIRGQPQVIQPPKNPDAFDYRQLMRNKGIVYQHFVSAKNWQLIVADSGFSLHRTALQLQKWADRTLERAIDSPMEAGLASALIVGLKDELDDTLLRAYSATGIMHVLAVSGLHVGILFTILSFLLYPLKNHERGRWLFVAIVLLVLWAYALVTGLSPSVMRAALMFSLFNVAQLFHKRGSSFNTLALSAVILLSYNPLMLFQVGFQLSYTAVAGIMYFYPRFYRCWKAPASPLNFADRTWSVICVSTAAQLATFPLGMYYFHQFPNYFLLANLFAIPLAFCMLSWGILILIFSWQPLLIQGLGWVMKWLVWLNNYLAFQVEALPYSAAKALYISAWEMTGIYAIIIALAVFFVLKHRLLLVAALLAATAFGASKLWTWQSQRQEQLLAVFYTARQSSMLWLKGQQAILLADSTLLEQPQQIRYTFAEFLARRSINWEQIPVVLADSETSPIAARKVQGGMLYRKGEMQVYRLAKRVRKPVLPPCDLLLIANNALFDLNGLPADQLREVRCIVLEGNNSPATVRRIKQQAIALGLTCHALATDGAFVWKY